MFNTDDRIGEPHWAAQSGHAAAKHAHAEKYPTIWTTI